MSKPSFLKEIEQWYSSKWICCGSNFFGFKMFKPVSFWFLLSFVSEMLMNLRQKKIKTKFSNQRKIELRQIYIISFNRHSAVKPVQEGDFSPQSVNFAKLLIVRYFGLKLYFFLYLVNNNNCFPIMLEYVMLQ